MFLNLSRYICENIQIHENIFISIFIVYNLVHESIEFLSFLEIFFKYHIYINREEGSTGRHFMFCNQNFKNLLPPSNLVV